MHRPLSYPSHLQWSEVGRIGEWYRSFQFYNESKYILEKETPFVKTFNIFSSQNISFLRKFHKIEEILVYIENAEIFNWYREKKNNANDFPMQAINKLEIFETKAKASTKLHKIQKEPTERQRKLMQNCRKSMALDKRMTNVILIDQITNPTKLEKSRMKVCTFRRRKSKFSKYIFKKF